MNNSKLVFSLPPYILSENTTQKIMAKVIIALFPTLIASGLIFGFKSIMLTLITNSACIGFECIYNILLKKEHSVADLSCIVTGIILAFNLPANSPWYLAVLGSFIAIIIVKQLFGGLGHNFVNPAMFANMVLIILFSNNLFSSAPPINAKLVPTKDTILTLLLGLYDGNLGETCAILLISGGLYLILTKTISAIIPFTYIGTVALFSYFTDKEPLIQILTGGLILGAFFIATDFTTSPFTRSGKLIFGICLGLLTTAIRLISNSDYAVIASILIMNLFVPLINSFTRQIPLGFKRRNLNV